MAQFIYQVFKQIQSKSQGLAKHSVCKKLIKNKYFFVLNLCYGTVLLSFIGAFKDFDF